MPALIYPLLCLIAIGLQGAWSWIALPFNLLLVPALDHGLRACFPHWRPRSPGLHLLFHRGWIWAAALAQIAVVMLATVVVARGVDSLTFLGLASTVGIAGGCLGITAAHELVHRCSRADRALGLALLATVLYMHFRIEHVYGHHRHVGTLRDPGTARKGESFFAFLNRALVCGWVSAWRIEAARLRRRRVPALSAGNRMLLYLLIQVALLAAIGVLAGPLAVAFFIVQSFIAVHLLEATNYVQHYGLQRRSGAGGATLRVGAEHCWDSEFVLSSLLLFNLPRHAGHHVDTTVPCDRLQVAEGARVLPASFHLMVFLALIPGVWRWLMDRRLTPGGP